MRRYASIFAFVAALFIQVLGPGLSAEEEKKAKAAFNFNSILPLHKEYEDEDKDYIDFADIKDKTLRKELKALYKTYGYNYFESCKSASMTALQDKTIEYRLDDSMNLYCKITLKKIQTWIDDEDKEHKYITFSARVVERPRDAVGMVVEKKVVDIERTRESGKYLLLVFRGFFPKTEDEPAHDLILAVQAQA